MSKELQSNQHAKNESEGISYLVPRLTPKVQSRIQPKVVSRIQPKWQTNVDKGNEKENSSLDQLPEEVQAKMENSFGEDFSNVTIHKDSTSAENINAKAYTKGTNVHFAPGEYDPSSKQGQELIGHELTHVVQQGQGRVGQGEVHGKGLEINQDEGLEKEADEKGKLASEGKEIKSVSYSSFGVQLKPTDNPPLSSAFFNTETSFISINLDDSSYLMIGNRGGDVIRLQEALVALRSTPTGFKVDGIFGIETYKAVFRFQSKVGFKRGDLDGVFGSKTLAKMDSLLVGQTPPIRIEDIVDIGLGYTFDVPVKQSFAPGNTNVSPSVAFSILENISKGESPFKPEKGRGGASWFVTEGSPFVGVDPSKNITIPAEIESNAPRITFKESQLLQILQEELLNTKDEAELKYRQYNKIPPDAPFSNSQNKSFKRFHERFAESRMWDRVGKMVSSSAEKAGEVILEAGSKFSKTPGKFAVVADAAKIRIKGGIEALITSLERQGLKAEPAVAEAAGMMASKMKWAGRVRATFKYGGRVLIVVAIAADAYKIYKAESKMKAIVEVAGGWVGATIASSAFAAWFAPADIAGPWAWLAHGAGTLVAGGIGYWVGSSSTKMIYELVLED